MTLLGRLVASAVQNLRAYEAERATVDELRRLSSLRADFVSLVSHELRSPMAAVIGSARTLQAALARAPARAARGVPRRDRGRDDPALRARRRRARHLSDRGRHLRLQLLGRRSRRDRARLGRRRGDRPGRGAALARAADDAAARPRRRRAAAAADRQPDLERGQVLGLGGGGQRPGRRRTTGTWSCASGTPAPGSRSEHQRQIFEKFGRAAGSAKPGTGLGLFLARSFAEAHGGSLDRRIAARRGRDVHAGAAAAG